ncbi:nuclear receptor corepressor 1-like [Zophobas morio]|uniref:nuclear receptor corepressor 1-like n=1 Tax=Zophobas morio TaxID=2755281 RepID=UPI0030826DAF
MSPSYQEKEIAEKYFFEKEFSRTLNNKSLSNPPLSTMTNSFGRRSHSRGGDAVRSEAEMEQVLLELMAQERRAGSSEKWKCAMATIPCLLTEDERRVKFFDRNRLLFDKRLLLIMEGFRRPWLDAEKEIFLEKYMSVVNKAMFWYNNNNLITY